jgi:ABC-type transport system involved in multi-copper enzyme maturation permease subunit
VSRGRLGRYSVWQFRDFAVEKSVAVLIIGVLLGYLTIEPVRRAMGANWAQNPAFPLTRILATIVSPVISLSVLIALNGMVSNDRKTGYYRFLFSKPISPVLYYAQLFAVHLVGVIATMAVLSGVFRIWVGPIAILSVLLYTAIVYVAMGGLGFFISATTRYDWVVLSVVWVGSRILRTVYSTTHDLRARLVQVLPPVHRIDDVSNNLLTGQMAATSDMLWLVGYGALFFILGLYVIHRRSLVD